MVNEQEMMQEQVEQQNPDHVEDAHVDTTPEEQQLPPRNQESYIANLRNMRKKYEQAEREKAELLKLMQERVGVPHQPENFDFNIGDDDIVEGKHISRVKKQLNSELTKVREELTNLKFQNQQMAAENKARTKYPDLDKVLSPDNIEMLRDIDPDAAQSIASINDPYAQFTFAYLTIKDKVLNNQDPYQHKKAVAQVERNMQKPRASATMSPQQGDSPLTKANLFGEGLTPELAKSLREEMNKYARRI